MITGGDVTTPVFASRVLLNRERMLLARTYKRDSRGRFGSGGGPGSGRNLIDDQATVDRMFQDSTDENGQFKDEGKGDPGLAAIVHEQGFDAKPTTVSDSEFDRIVQERGAEVFYRGVKGADDLSAADIHGQFRDGEYESGYGIFGNGFYMTPDASVAERYADGTPGSVGRFALDEGARVIDYADLRGRHNETISMRWDTVADSTEILSADPGRFAAMLGYDAVRLSAGSTVPGMGTMSQTQIIILNRGALIAAAGS